MREMGPPWLEGGQSGHGAGNALNHGLSTPPCLVNDLRAVCKHTSCAALATATAGLAATATLDMSGESNATWQSRCGD
jgi:hypothetical protein